jgi:diguanylate cyclase (GGDEF)-like protein
VAAIRARVDAPSRIDTGLPMDRAVDPTASLSRLERSLLSVSKRRGTAPFIAAVAAISIALSVAFTSLAMMAVRADRQDFIVALVISVVVPAVVAPAAASMLGRLLLAIDAASVELSHLARIDALTGALNRRAFAAEAEAMIVRRGVETLVVAMVDLDDFKGVNDRFGHGSGDSVLIELADALHDAIGGDGIVGRFGGDEFVALVLVPGDATEAVARLDATLDLGHVVRGVTASIGLIVTDEPVSLAEAMTRADHALYRAKRGRTAIDASPPASPAHLRSADADRP